jgi:hypothetical protein
MSAVEAISTEPLAEPSLIVWAARDRVSRGKYSRVAFFELSLTLKISRSTLTTGSTSISWIFILVTKVWVVPSVPGSGWSGKVTSSALAGSGAANHNEVPMAATRSRAAATRTILRKFKAGATPSVSRGLDFFRACSERSSSSVLRSFSISAISGGILPASVVSSSWSALRGLASRAITLSLGAGKMPFSILLR